MRIFEHIAWIAAFAAGIALGYFVGSLAGADDWFRSGRELGFKEGIQRSVEEAMKCEVDSRCWASRILRIVDSTENALYEVGLGARPQEGQRPARVVYPERWDQGRDTNVSWIDSLYEADSKGD